MSAPEDVWSVTVPTTVPTGSFSAMKNLVVGKPKGGGGAQLTQINTSSVEVLRSGMPRSVATTESLKSPAGTEVPTRKMLPKLLSILKRSVRLIVFAVLFDGVSIQPLLSSRKEYSTVPF